MRTLKVAIFGSNGRIGRATIAALLGFANGSSLRLAFISRTPTHLGGIIADLRYVAPWIISSAHDLASLPADIAEFDLIILLSGAVASESERTAASQFDATGRLAQSLANGRILQEVAGVLLSAGGEPTVLVVSNQSDHMSYLLRRCGLARVFGFGLMLDTLRYRAISGNEAGITVGFHSHRLLIPAAYVAATFRSSLREDIERVSRSGSQISQLYKRQSQQGGQSGSIYGPALCLAQTIAAFAGMIPPLIAVYNVGRQGHPLCAVIESDANLGIGLPLRIEQGRFSPVSLAHSATEIASLRSFAVDTLEEAEFVEHRIR